MTTAVLLDLDGTLVDSRKDLSAAANAARAALGLPALPIETIVSYVGDGLGKLLERSCPQMDAKSSQIAHQAFQTYYLKHCCDFTTCYDGIHHALEQLNAADFKLAVVTNKPKQFADIILQQLGLSPFISFVIGGDDKRKPDPEPLLISCKALGLPVHEAWMCGDHHTDLIAGRRAGARTIWCSWGLGNHGGEAYDVACASPEELLQVIHGHR